MKQKDGWVYLMSGNGLYKLGLTTNLLQRCKSFRGLPFEVNLVHFIRTDDPGLLEKKWHYLFRNQRVRGEWFDLDPDDILLFLGSNEFNPFPGEMIPSY